MDAFFQSVAGAFTGNRAHLPLVEAVLAALLALVLLLQVVALARALLARRSRFHRLMTAHGLGREDIRYAAELAARVALPPVELVTQLDHFERATAQALASGDPGAAAAAARILRLRHALGYDRLPPHTPLLTTRELGVGMAVEVGAQAGAVAEVDEAGFAVVLRQPPDLPAGQQVALTLTHAREARYALGCRLLDAHPEPGGGWRLRLDHDEHPVRQQQREWARVALAGAVALHPVTRWQALPGAGGAAPSGDVSARLVDLSGGGARVTSRVALPVGALVHAAFQVGAARFEGLRTVVLACRPGADGGHELQLEFTGRPGAERERLVAALTQAELEGLAASRS
jgi:hypothetical protein